MDSKEKDYKPRPGSKVSAALEVMKSGPVAVAALASVIQCPENNVSTVLFQALKNDLVVKVFDAAGVQHFMSGESELPEGFRFVRGIVTKQAPDPNDPFGLAGKRQAPPAGPAANRPPADAAPAAKPAAPAAQPTAPAGATTMDTSGAVRPAAGIFVAALFSTGELMIQVGDDQVFLSREHQRELRQYCARFESAQ